MNFANLCGLYRRSKEKFWQYKYVLDRQDITFGCELETVGLSVATASDLLYTNGLRVDHVYADGSLWEEVSHRYYKRVYRKGRVAEVSSPVFRSYEEGKQWLNKACNLLVKEGARVNWTCGGHIHVGHPMLQYPEHYGYDNDTMEDKIYYSDVWEKGHILPGARGRHIGYFRPEMGTIEWRLWSGTLDPEKWLARAIISAAATLDILEVSYVK